VSFRNIFVFPNGRDDRRMAFSFREAEKLAVSRVLDYLNNGKANRGHPEITYEIAPSSVFTLDVQMLASEGEKAKNFGFFFREEEMAQRVANAMVHAIELCGCGSKDPF
jgi:hypothetical protein